MGVDGRSSNSHSYPLVSDSTTAPPPLAPASTASASLGSAAPHPSPFPAPAAHSSGPLPMSSMSLELPPLSEAFSRAAPLTSPGPHSAPVGPMTPRALAAHQHSPRWAGMHDRGDPLPVSEAYTGQRRTSHPARLPSGAESHDKSPSGPSDKVYTCNQCSMTFQRFHNLKSHKLTHSQERPYACTTCGSNFRRQHDLKRHMKGHTGERPYTCHRCGRSFARMDALNRHRRAENGHACSMNQRLNRQSAATPSRKSFDQAALAAGDAGPEAVSPPHQATGLGEGATDATSMAVQTSPHYQPLPHSPTDHAPRLAQLSINTLLAASSHSGAGHLPPGSSDTGHTTPGEPMAMYRSAPVLPESVHTDEANHLKAPFSRHRPSASLSAVVASPMESTHHHTQALLFRPVQRLEHAGPSTKSHGHASHPYRSPPPLVPSHQPPRSPDHRGLRWPPLSATDPRPSYHPPWEKDASAQGHQATPSPSHQPLNPSAMGSRRLSDGKGVALPSLANLVSLPQVSGVEPQGDRSMRVSTDWPQPGSGSRATGVYPAAPVTNTAAASGRGDGGTVVVGRLQAEIDRLHRYIGALQTKLDQAHIPYQQLSPMLERTDSAVYSGAGASPRLYGARSTDHHGGHERHRGATDSTAAQEPPVKSPRLTMASPPGYLRSGLEANRAPAMAHSQPDSQYFRPM
ncbi:hypothetical protein H4R34_000199 [Dimargaris verticillata]|uniref:C2H2-type domain-containing protein n=1 Tax=Dimargaris verticillata TaxID=2761393 RepID=A0A9W8B7H1_9FUNG|nr:hypothetical protein H4R34_000199 [Dimargaris verticillata]